MKNEKLMANEKCKMINFLTGYNKVVKKKYLLIGIPLLLVVIVSSAILASRNVVKAPADTKNDSVTVNTSGQAPAVKEIIYPVQLTIEQAQAINVVVNKKHKLPDNYAPTLTAVAGGQMRPEAASELRKLLNAATATGIKLMIISSYRSFNTQVSTYDGWVTQYGQTRADTFSARPGFSEHQTGLGVDLGNNDGSCALEICFGDSTAGLWLASNASNYGFIIRYPEGKEAETGYQYEPWHIRYLGVDTAKDVVETGKTFDQYMNVVAGEY